MSTEIELLPLPKWMSNYTIPADSSVYDKDVILADRMHDYARANVAVATATLQAEIERLCEQLRLATVDQATTEAEANDARAEIEALRAEVDEWKSVASAQAELHDEAERCAEELAKALAELITWIPSADTYRRLGFDPAAPMRALEKARAALGREAGND